MSTQQYAGEERFVRQYEYDDCYVLAADLNVADGDVQVDVIGSTAIVVVETGDSVTESEFELPGTDPSVETNNGVLTITVRK